VRRVAAAALALAAVGALEPAAHGEPPPGWFVFAPRPDPFKPAALDLRPLNEAFSGEHGFIEVKGDSFVHGKTGEPVRFWAVNIGEQVLREGRAALDRFARHLAKVGVNMVRLHVSFWRADDVARVDETRRDELQQLVAALRAQGIYLDLSTFWPYWLRPKGVPGFTGFAADDKAWALPFFDERLQELQRGWWKALLTAPNPYTGVPLVDDPTLAFMEILNEDGLFFWTFSPDEDLPRGEVAHLEELFGRWLGARYGGVAQAFAAWGESRLLKLVGWRKVGGDDADAGRAGILSLSAILERRDARARDTTEFLTDLQRRYFDGARAYLKTELGFKGSVAGSNWITADARVFGPLDKWSNAGCDYLDHHGYYSGPHEGPDAGWKIRRGDRYNDASALRFEDGKGGTSFDLPIMDLAYNGKPSTVSEVSWTPPNRTRADMPVIAAAYGALQGTDAFAFFLARETGWATELDKFSVQDPVIMGQFPAAALIYRGGLVRTGAVSLRFEASLRDLYQLEGIAAAAPRNLDALRARDLGAGTAAPRDAGGMDPLAFLTGRVEVNVSAQGAASRVTDLSRLIDHGAKVVRSNTGELRWDYGRGLVTIDAPAAQGVTGFLSKAGAVALGDVTISSPLDYGSILVVSMDGKPLASSRKLLLQVMSEDNNTGWSAPGTGQRTIVSVGGPPFVVKQLAGRVALRRADAPTLKVRPLDLAGYATGSGTPLGAARAVDLLPTTLYYVIEK
jgi:hypothetical protein